MSKRFRTPAGHTRDEFYSRLIIEVPKAMKDEILAVSREKNTYMSGIVREAITQYLDDFRYKKEI